MNSARKRPAAAINAPVFAREIAVGAASGLAAAWLMARFQTLWDWAASAIGQSGGGEGAEPATVRAANTVAVATVGAPIPEGSRPVAGAAVHYGFGTFLGAVYSALGLVLPRIRSAFGTAYGTAVGIVADEALVPAAGLSPPPHKVPLSTHAYGFASHLVYGAALEGSRRLADHRLRKAERRLRRAPRRR